LHMIETGRIDPTQIISHRMKLEEAAKGYQMFDGKGEVHKIVLTP
jgi:threonine dehydrogenase-like Zn-dependent dehydrogenase